MRTIKFAWWILLIVLGLGAGLGFLACTGNTVKGYGGLMRRGGVLGVLGALFVGSETAVMFGWWNHFK